MGFNRGHYCYTLTSFRKYVKVELSNVYIL